MKKMPEKSVTKNEKKKRAYPARFVEKYFGVKELIVIIIFDSSSRYYFIDRGSVADEASRVQEPLLVFCHCWVVVLVLY
jgi:hypothetical protein